VKKDSSPKDWKSCLLTEKELFTQLGFNMNFRLLTRGLNRKIEALSGKNSGNFQFSLSTTKVSFLTHSISEALEEFKFDFRFFNVLEAVSMKRISI
jgi:hypothetical protein